MWYSSEYKLVRCGRIFKLNFSRLAKLLEMVEENVYH